MLVRRKNLDAPPPTNHYKVKEEGADGGGTPETAVSDMEVANRAPPKKRQQPEQIWNRHQRGRLPLRAPSRPPQSLYHIGRNKADPQLEAQLTTARSDKNQRQRRLNRKNRRRATKLERDGNATVKAGHTITGVGSTSGQTSLDWQGKKEAAVEKKDKLR